MQQTAARQERVLAVNYCPVAIALPLPKLRFDEDTPEHSSRSGRGEKSTIEIIGFHSKATRRVCHITLFGVLKVIRKSAGSFVLHIPYPLWITSS